MNRKDDRLTRSEEFALEEIREILGERPVLIDRLRVELHEPRSVQERADDVRILSVIYERMYDEEFSAEDLALCVGRSRSSLERFCRETFGLTPGSLIRVMRMEAAAELLATSEAGIGQIAFSVGYSGVAQFSRAFKSCFGVSPSAWRGRARAQSPSLRHSEA